MRKLHLLPIVHSAADLGRLVSTIEQSKLRWVSQDRIESSKEKVARFWSEVRNVVESDIPEPSSLFVYQDALPVVPEGRNEMHVKIIRELADLGSANHQVLMWLLEKGATILGTESPELLVKEYRLVRQKLAQESNVVQEELQDKSADRTEPNILATELADLLIERDRFIAHRIASTLPAEAAGILFIGMLHEVEKHLPEDIVIHYPIGRPSLTPLTSPPILQSPGVLS